MHDFQTEHERRAYKYESHENVWHKSTIKNNKILKIDLMKIIESSVKGMIKKHKKIGTKQEAHGPQVAHLSDTATADMQHFSNPVIATNEKIII